jgi:predicted Zn-dependent peptidase
VIAPQPIFLPVAAAPFEAVIDETDTLRRTVLPNGVRVLTQSTPGAHSATVGFWVPVGSRDEAPGEYGSTHFLEHLLFKGTPDRSALDLAMAFDRVGAESNAVTAKEYTCYYARERAEDVPLVVGLIADMVLSSTIPPDQFDSEREVILEELAAAADDPADIAQERFAGLVYGSELGRPIGGTPQTIATATRAGVLHHYHSHYRPETVVVTVAGAVDHQAVCDLVAAACAGAGWSAPAEPAPRRPQGRARVAGAGGEAAAGRTLVVPKDAEQVNLVVGAPGIAASDPDRFAVSVWSALFGGGVSSRLFQEVRERRGLVYTVYSFAEAHSDAGMFGMFAASRPSRAGEVVELLRRLAAEFAQSGPTADEVALAQGQLVGGMTLALEDTHPKMSRLGRAELGTGVLYDLPAAVAAVRAVGTDDVARVAGAVLCQPLSVCAVGPIDAAALAPTPRSRNDQGDR